MELRRVLSNCPYTPAQSGSVTTFIYQFRSIGFKVPTQWDAWPRHCTDCCAAAGFKANLRISDGMISLGRVLQCLRWVFSQDWKILYESCHCFIISLHCYSQFLFENCIPTILISYFELFFAYSNSLCTYSIRHWMSHPTSRQTFTGRLYHIKKLEIRFSILFQ